MPDELKPFEREERYIVVKRKRLPPAQETRLRDFLHTEDIETVESAVVESDWPEYETVWKMIEERCTRPTPPSDPQGADCSDGLEELLDRFGLILTDNPEFDHDEMTFAKAKTAFIAALLTAEQGRQSERTGDIASIWRNGITNTAIVIDHVRERHQEALRRNKSFAAFDRDLNEALQTWFDATRKARPLTYEQAEQVWRDTLPTLTKGPTDEQ